MAKSLELKRKAGQTAKEMIAVRDEANGNWTPELEERFKKLDGEYERLMNAATLEERAEQISKVEVEEAKHVEKTLKPGDLDPEKKKAAENLAMREYLRTGSVPMELRDFMKPAKAEADDNKRIAEELKAIGITRAAQQSTTDGAGGYTIPQGFQAELDRGVKAFGGMFEAARIWNTSTGNDVLWPNNNDTANKAYLLAEAGNAESAATAATFGAPTTFNAFKYTSGLIRISSELITDSAFNMPALIADLLSERMYRGLNEVFTVGDGSSKPRGVVTASTYGGSSADDADISSDDILELIHSVDPGYRNRPGTRLMFNDNILYRIKKLSTSTTDKRPLWLPSIREGEPATIFGYRYTINQDMATWADAAKAMLFGDFQKYIIRQVAGMRMVRLNERFGDTDEIGFVVFFRVDGDLLDAGTHPIKHLRVSAT